MGRTKPTRRQAVLACALAPALLQAEEVPRKPTTLADYQLEILKLRHGKFLTPERLEATRQALVSMQATAERLRRARVADEPATIFSPDLP
ncbi:MAG: hypothetical protein U0840_06435 [Gemmataceae bacterium]